MAHRARRKGTPQATSGIEPDEGRTRHFTFDAGGAAQQEKPDPAEIVRLWFTDGTAPVDVNADVDGPDHYHEEGLLNDIFYSLELLSDDSTTFAITDCAGEVFWFCADEVALFMASEELIAVDGAEDEVDDEELDSEAASADKE
jgi:hypothetical protein